MGRNAMRARLACLALLTVLPFSGASAQQNSAEEEARRETALRQLPIDAARRIFFLAKKPAKLSPAAIGLYGKGCLAGAQLLEPEGRGWQVMRLSRGRNYAHPDMVAYIKKLAREMQAVGWPGLLIGDMAQARGGPMLTGHASHQLGLEADIWLTPAPKGRLLTNEEREEMSAIDMVRSDLLNVYSDRFTLLQVELLRRAASPQNVDRIFVNPAIKKAACDMTKGERYWLRKLRPWHGHTYHFHVALKCPGKSCKNRASIPAGEGCGKDLTWWFREEVRFPKPKPSAPEKILTLRDLPKECTSVVNAL